MSTLRSRVLLSLTLGAALIPAGVGAGPRFVLVPPADTVTASATPRAGSRPVRRLAKWEAAESQGVEQTTSLPPASPAAASEVGRDAIANDRSLDNCLCGGGPVSESEPSVAAWGRFVVASWNTRRRVCIPMSSALPSQTYGYSANYGVSFREGALLHGPLDTDSFHGDPTVAVNAKTGQFYISGVLRRGGSNFVGIVALRGHFEADTLAIDVRKVIALTQGDDFLDKPWMAVDSLSGNVYITWTNFHSDQSTAIELQRLDANLDPLGPIQPLRAMTSDVYGLQSSFPVVGPGGELLISWSVLYSVVTQIAVWNVPSWLEAIRSDDGGVTFGPPKVITDFQYHPYVLQPGTLRGFGVSAPAMDVDRTNGPHRGRAYVTWPDERGTGGVVVDSATSVFEKEKNDFFANATAFAPGVRLRGVGSGIEKDIFKFTGTRGQVFYCSGDSVTGSVKVYLVCSADTSGLAQFHVFSSRTGGGSGQMIVGLPYDGTYYLYIDSFANQVSTYVFSTGLVPTGPLDRSRDIRDMFLSWSDDGANWSAPIRLNDDPPGNDAVFPQVAVDGRGRVHAFWMDWRNDPVCGTSSDQYITSSGDGGITWSPNRRLTAASSFWGATVTCTSNNQGDFNQMAADGDHVYSAFTDARLGDPDIFVNAASFSAQATCPPAQTVLPGQSASVGFTLRNGGNFQTALAWRVVEEKGWLTGATPAASGTQSLAPGALVQVSADFTLPANCVGDSSAVLFVTDDPYIPGAYDTCRTFVRCDQVVPVLISLVESRVTGDVVDLVWHAGGVSDRTADISRRAAGGVWISRGTTAVDDQGYVRFEDHGVQPGTYTYRLTLAETQDQVTVDVPALALALQAQAPNPATGGALSLSFTLPAAAPTFIDLVSLAGRRIATYNASSLGPGTHTLKLADSESLMSGVYLVLLRQNGKEVSRKVVVIPH